MEISKIKWVGCCFFPHKDLPFKFRRKESLEGFPILLLDGFIDFRKRPVAQHESAEVFDILQIFGIFFGDCQHLISDGRVGSFGRTSAIDDGVSI